MSAGRSPRRATPQRRPTPGRAAIALRALLDAARLGDIRAADSIERLTGEVDCVLGQLALQHARGRSSPRTPPR